MTMKLNVCSGPVMRPYPITRNSTDWVGYIVLNGRAVIVASGCLDDLRYYAGREGYDGILIGSPSVPFATIKTI